MDKFDAEKGQAGLDELHDRIDRYEQALQQIESWADAYPLDIFPEPDFPKAIELLKAGGITLDSISASCMRHVVKGVGKIAKEALHGDEEKGTADGGDV